MERIDTHIHFFGDHPECVALLERLAVKVLNITFVHDEADPWRDQAGGYGKLAAEFPQRFAWCTSFDLPRFDDPDYIDKAIAGLKQDIAAGAIACKIWKNIGMAVRKPSGEFLLIDDPLFEPIYDFLTRENITLLLHIAEPLACWQPLVDNNPHYNYYRNNPEWHMFNKPDYPSHQTLIDARDRMVAQHPDLRVVGAHFGSLEYDVAEVAKRLERYPNFAVDSSARLMDLTYQDPQVVRQFFRDFSDRLLFGTDIVRAQPFSQMPEEKRQAELAMMEARFQEDFAYFGTDKVMTIRGREVQALGLGTEVLDRFYVKNAQTWYPGL